MKENVNQIKEKYMKNQSKYLVGVLVGLVVFLVSCTKDPGNFTSSGTWTFQPYEKPVLMLKVLAWQPYYYADAIVRDCKVKVYKSKTDFEQDVNAVDSGTTNYQGVVGFELDSLHYWFRAEKGCMNNDLFTYESSGVLSRYLLNFFYVPISGVSRIQFRNKTNKGFFAYSPESSHYSSPHFLKPLGELTLQLPSNATAVALEKLTETTSNTKRNYPLNMDCGDSVPIDVY